MTRLRKLGMGLVVAGVCLVGMEASARVLAGSPTPPFVATMPAPGEAGEWLARTPDGRVEATYQDKFAIEPFPAEPDGAHPRVLWLGGSSVRGGRGKSRPGFEMPGVTALRIGGAEILNLGAPGVDSRHLWAMTPELLALQPDALVIYTGHNDLGNVLFEDAVPDESAARTMRVRGVLRHSRLFELMEQGEQSVTGLREGEEDPDDARVRLATLSDSQRAAVLAQFERRLRWIVRAAHKEGVEVVLVTVVSNAQSPAAEWRCPELMIQAGFPPTPNALPPRVDDSLLVDSDCADAQWFLAMSQLGANPDATETLLRLRDDDPWSTRAGRPTNDVIRRVAAEEGATLVDMAAVAQEQGGGVEPPGWFSDPIHLTRAGHSAIAEQVAPALAEVLDMPMTGKHRPPPRKGNPPPRQAGVPRPGGLGGVGAPPPGGPKGGPPPGSGPPPGGHKGPPPGGFHGQAPPDVQ